MQTSYSVDQDAAIIGGLYDIGFNDVMSFVSEEKAYYGHFVTKGTEDDEVRAPTASGDITDVKLGRGVVVRTQAIESNDDSDDPHYSIGETINVLRKGRVWVQVENAVTPEDAVYVRHTDTATYNRGSFRGADNDG